MNPNIKKALEAIAVIAKSEEAISQEDMAELMNSVLWLAGTNGFGMGWAHPNWFGAAGDPFDDDYIWEKIGDAVRNGSHWDTCTKCNATIRDFEACAFDGGDSPNVDHKWQSEEEMNENTAPGSSGCQHKPASLVEVTP